MFDFAWSQIALIAVVALIVIGPKDLPVAIRAITNTIKKARRMAAEFQTHVDEMVRDANLQDVRNQISDIRNFDIRTEIEKAVDPDGKIRDTFASNPLDPNPAPASNVMPEVVVAEPAVPPVLAPISEATGAAPAVPDEPLAPAFIPPNMIPPAEAKASVEEPPPWVPPEIVHERTMRPPA